MEKFSHFIEFKVDKGTQTRFWTDVWCGAMSLKDSFPELFRIRRVPNAYVKNHLQFYNDVLHWELDFVLQDQDWELESIPTFLELLYVKGHGEDQLCWKPIGTHILQVRSFYSLLNLRDNGTFLWKSTWKPCGI